MSDSNDKFDWSDDPRLVAHAFGELAGEERAEIERALLGDPSCRAALDDITAFLPEIESAVRAGGAGVGLESEALASIAAAARRGPARRRRAWTQPALAAAAALFVTTIIAGRLLDKSQPPDVSVASRDRSIMTVEHAGEMIIAKRQSEGSVARSLSTRPSLEADGTSGRPAAKMSTATRSELERRRSSARDSVGAQDGESEDQFVMAGLEPAQELVPTDTPFRAFRGGELEINLEDEQTPRRERLSLDGDEEAEEEIDEAFELGAVIQPVVAAPPENAFVLAKDDPLSTFSIDVDTASYTNARRSIMDGRFPSPADIRVEEFVNYFSYDDVAPAADAEHPFAVRIDSGAAPWMPQHRLVRISLKGRAIDYGERASANLVFLVDVSGSMSSDDKLPLVKKALAMLTETLDSEDRVAIVVYASAQGLALPSTPVAAREAILQSLEKLDAGGSTNGGAGIQLAYSIAAENFVEGGVNRVILCTDGDFNVGVTSDEGLEELIAEKARSGIDLTVLGFGTGNFKDAKMEALSNRGNGNFAYLDSEFEARKVLVTEAGGTLNTIARDVKLQVVWNPSRVQAFRLIGYENRMLEHADFADDAKDAGEIGAGHVVTALYEVVPWGVLFDTDTADGAKPDPVALDVAGGAPPTGPFVTVRLRYKLPGEETSILFDVLGIDSGDSFDAAPESLRFSAAVAAFGMLLRGSSHAGGATLRDVRRWALESLGADPGGLRAGFVELVEKTIELGE